MLKNKKIWLVSSLATLLPLTVVSCNITIKENKWGLSPKNPPPNGDIEHYDGNNNQRNNNHKVDLSYLNESFPPEINIVNGEGLSGFGKWWNHSKKRLKTGKRYKSFLLQIKNIITELHSKNEDFKADNFGDENIFKKLKTMFFNKKRLFNKAMENPSQNTTTIEWKQFEFDDKNEIVFNEEDLKGGETELISLLFGGQYFWNKKFLNVIESEVDWELSLFTFANNNDQGFSEQALNGGLKLKLETVLTKIQELLDPQILLALNREWIFLVPEDNGNFGMMATNQDDKLSYNQKYWYRTYLEKLIDFYLPIYWQLFRKDEILDIPEFLGEQYSMMDQYMITAINKNHNKKIDLHHFYTDDEMKSKFENWVIENSTFYSWKYGEF
ncbi:hypothetical protein ACW95P_01825 [Candidatus Mycoplasma pogonae]